MYTSLKSCIKNVLNSAKWVYNSIKNAAKRTLKPFFLKCTFLRNIDGCVNLIYPVGKNLAIIHHANESARNIFPHKYYVPRDFNWYQNVNFLGENCD